jgi:sugar lactone lactonase YvrE
LQCSLRTCAYCFYLPLPAAPQILRFADAAIEAADGTVYFSDACTGFGFDQWFLAYIESRPTGRLLKYDPRTGDASVELDNLAFANGVALSRDEAFVVVCESGGYVPEANSSFALHFL